MATIVNNPGNSDGDGAATGLLVGIVVVILFFVILLVYGLPQLRNSGALQQSPQGGSGSQSPKSESGVNVNIPDKIDVNVDTNTQAK